MELEIFVLWKVEVNFAIIQNGLEETCFVFY
jgi:hypothetical protein